MLDIANINNYPINEVKDNFNALELTTLNFGVALKPITFQCQFQGEIPFYDNEIPKELGRLVLKTNPDNIKAVKTSSFFTGSFSNFKFFLI